MALEWQNYNFIGPNFAVGGINLKSAVTNIKDSETPNCKNVIFGQTGAIQKREGYSKLNLQQIPGAPSITGIFQLQKSDGTSCDIIGAGTDLYDSATAPVSIYTGQTPGALYDFAALNDFAFIVNGVDPNLKYNCSGSPTQIGIDPPVTAPTYNSAIAGANLTFPGFYQYVVTFVDASGFESNPSPASAIMATIAVTQDIRINIPVSADPQVVARNIYRTSTDGVSPIQPFLFTGTVADNITLTFDDHTPDANLGVEAEFDNDKPPVLKFIETSQQRLWGVEAANPNRVRFSKTFNHQAWPTLFFIDVNPDDGDMISGIISFFDILVVFKRESIYVISGQDETNFVLQRAQTDSRIGCVAFRSIAVVNNFVVFLSERGIYAFDGLRTQYLSENLEGIFDKGNPNQQRQFNWAQQGISNAVNYKNRSRNWYFLNIPTGSSTSNNLVLLYDYVLSNWTLFEGIYASSSAIVHVNNEPVLFSGDYNGFLWKQDDTNNDGWIHFPSFSTSNTNTAFTLRDETQASFDSGTGVYLVRTATSGGASTITDSTLTMNAGEHSGQQIYIESGTGAGQTRSIASNDATTFTVTVAWGVVPDATSHYIVGGWPVDALKGIRVKILEGLDHGDIREITTNIPVEFTITVAWSTIPNTLSKYSVGFIEAEWDSRWFNYNQPEFFKRLRYLQVNTDREGNYPLLVGTRYDFFTGDQNTFFNDLSLSGADSVWDVSLWDMASWDQVSQVITRLSNPSGNIHRYVQIIFRNEGGDEPFTVNSLNLVYQIKGVRGQ